MKKMILFIGLLLLAVGLQAQSGSTVTMTNTSAKYSPVVSDTINGTATKYWTFLINRPNLYYYVVTAEFDELKTVNRSVGNHVILTMSGSVDGTNYVVMDTTLFHPAATGNYREGKVLTAASDVSTGVLWKYIKFSASGLDASKGATLKSLAIKVGDRY